MPLSWPIELQQQKVEPGGLTGEKPRNTGLRRRLYVQVGVGLCRRLCLHTMVGFGFQCDPDNDE